LPVRPASEDYVLLSRELLQTVPVWVRWVPGLYNCWCKRLFRQVLQQRDPQHVAQAWTPYASLGPLPQQVIETIAAVYRWPAERLLPDDSCFVLLGCWLRQVADEMELEHVLLQLEERGISLPEAMIEQLDRLSLGQLIAELNEHRA